MSRYKAIKNLGQKTEHITQIRQTVSRLDMNFLPGVEYGARQTSYVSGPGLEWLELLMAPYGIPRTADSTDHTEQHIRETAWARPSLTSLFWDEVRKERGTRSVD